MYILAPSVLAADFGKLGEAVQETEKGGGPLHPPGCNGRGLCTQYLLWDAGSLFPERIYEAGI